jgi:hypothetical protein
MDNSVPASDQPAEMPSREIGDDEYLSQYGSRQTGKPLLLESTANDGHRRLVGNYRPADSRGSPQARPEDRAAHER